MIPSLWTWRSVNNPHEEVCDAGGSSFSTLKAPWVFELGLTLLVVGSWK